MRRNTNRAAEFKKTHAINYGWPVFSLLLILAQIRSQDVVPGGEHRLYTDGFLGL